MPYASDNFLVTWGVGEGSGELQTATQNLGQWYFPWSEMQSYPTESVLRFRGGDAIFPSGVGCGVRYRDDELATGV